MEFHVADGIGSGLGDESVVIEKERLVCVACGFVFYIDPKIAVGTIIRPALRSAADHIVLVRRAIEPGYGKWVFPGGYVDFGENAADAAVRETREEVGMRVELGSLLGGFTDPESIALTIVVYLAKPGAEPPSISEEASEVRYFGPDEIPWHELAFPTTVDAITGWVASTRRQPNP